MAGSYLQNKGEMSVPRIREKELLNPNLKIMEFLQTLTDTFDDAFL